MLPLSVKSDCRELFQLKKNGRGGAAEHALAIYSLQSDTLGSESQLYYLLAV